ncbi:hypothetical protein GCM10007857_04640 [Bradyrhizobium iriomotense]|uniref:Transposase n=1 Tax=Bradyrhizobium iriomotense TaxID=441950 RepID=A0ABQ6AND0_9BRAD|nr:hypothetical protein GCM10007857_04640 [Bradyrhizobium iriomotense]
MIPGIGHRQDTIRGGNAGGEIERIGTNVTLGVPAFARELSLANQKIGRRLVVGRALGPYQKTVVAAVADEQWPVLADKTDPTRTKKRMGGGNDRLHKPVRSDFTAKDHFRAACRQESVRHMIIVRDGASLVQAYGRGRGDHG